MENCLELEHRLELAELEIPWNGSGQHPSKRENVNPMTKVQRRIAALPL
jgi:hypothetical protein